MICQVYKKLGETPLQALERCRAENNISSQTPMTYAGRLDPLAEGLMVVLSGSDVHRKEEFLALDKTYTLEVLWGVETDTYDLLGRPLNLCARPSVASQDIQAALRRWETAFEQPYPPFSSKPVQGKPLWQWAREGRLEEIEMPTREVSIYSIEDQGQRSITAEELLATVQERLQLVTGDFRQAEIDSAWSDLLSTRLASTFYLSKLAVNCSSGTYMRSLAHRLGQSIGVPACAFWIRRERVGDYGHPTDRTEYQSQ